MSTVFRLDASIRGNDSVTRGIADTLEREILDNATNTQVIRRDVAREPIDPHLWALALSGPLVPDTDGADRRDEAVRVATELADEMVSADAYVIAAPFYNFGVSQHVKTWIDVLFGDPRFGPGEQPLGGRPAYIVTARGGGYGPGTPREGWDHGTDWLKRIFGDVMGLDARLIETELTLAPLTPGMEDLRDLAEANLQAAHASAREVGKGLSAHLESA
ncbi:MAG: NAD(P)H-dependent oxidoreductase, partial [Actinomycetia bacterium]|nr:NAD(P)H-dependent oxidoreductase [Actinomycetes bacterium]